LSKSDFVLGFNPSLGFRRIVIFEPAIRVSHFNAAVIIHLIGLAGFRISKRRLRNQAPRKQSDNEKARDKRTVCRLMESHDSKNPRYPFKHFASTILVRA